MDRVHGLPSEQDQLLGVVRDVRVRWRLKRALRGAAITVASAFVLLIALSVVLDAANYAAGVIVASRVIGLLAVLVIAGRCIVLPALPRVRDDQVALYLEEHEPTMEGALVTAMDVRTAASQGIAPRSPALAGRLYQSAVARAGSIEGGRRVDGQSLQRGWAMLGGIVALSVVITLLGPPSFRHSLRLLVLPGGKAGAAALYSIGVEPGNLTVARGGDALVVAHLRGFSSKDVEVLFRYADSTSWERVAMVQDSTGRYTARLLDIMAPAEYAVSSNGVESPTFTIKVADLPYVKKLNVELDFPAYTQLPPVRDSSGDIAGIKGTLAKIRVATTLPTTGGRLVVEGGDTVRLVPQPDGSLLGLLRVEQSGFYRVELQGPGGAMVSGSLDYNIDMIPDRPPTVRFTKPGRDLQVMSVDEVYTEAVAKDDYGVAKLELIFSVNGGDEHTVPLSASTGTTLREIQAGHTFLLQDYRLQAGDVVSYYARATDNDAVSGPQSAMTDIYFMKVRPYARDYHQAEGIPGSGGQEPPGTFSTRERDIIAATFKSSRDSAQTEAKSLSEAVATIRLSQQKLRWDVATLAQQLINHGIAETDTNYKKIAEILPRATVQMDTAMQRLTAGQTTAARQPEQKALTELQRAEAVFHDIELITGGGGGGESDPADLADLFELRRDELRNQYEQVQTQQQQQTNQAINAVADKLKQLAQRMQQQDQREQQRLADLAAKMPPSRSGGGGGGVQRQAAQQLDPAARQLEQLARQQPDSQSATSAEAARRLQAAADNMRRAADAIDQQAKALQRLAETQMQQAQQLLSQSTATGTGRDPSPAARLADQAAGAVAQVQSLADRAQQSQSASGGGSGGPGSGQVGGGAPSTFDPQQIAREATQLVAQLQQMRAEAVRQHADVSQLDQAMSQIRSLSDAKAVGDPRTVGDLKNRTVTAMQQFEFGLRRALAGAPTDGIRAGASGEVPPGYQSLVEEYWREIARGSSGSSAATAVKKVPAKPPR